VNEAAFPTVRDGGGGSEVEAEPAAGTKPAPQRTGALRGFVEAFVIAVATMLVCRTFVVQAYRIPSMSMVPTLVRGDHLLISKVSYGLRSPLGGGWLTRYAGPAAGDVVVFAARAIDRNGEQEDRNLVKRVVATAGEEVEIRGSHVFVDGRERQVGPSFAVFGQRDAAGDLGPLRVPEGELFVMGDNREGSRDSRHWGFVDVEDVEGKAVLVFWSWEGVDRFVRWERVGRWVR
jgi:signal peptidase I